MTALQPRAYNVPESGRLGEAPTLAAAFLSSSRRYSQRLLNGGQCQDRSQHFRHRINSEFVQTQSSCGLRLAEAALYLAWYGVIGARVSAPDSTDEAANNPASDKTEQKREDRKKNLKPATADNSKLFSLTLNENHDSCKFMTPAQCVVSALRRD